MKKILRSSNCKNWRLGCPVGEPRLPCRLYMASIVPCRPRQGYISDCNLHWSVRWALVYPGPNLNACRLLKETPSIKHFVQLATKTRETSIKFINNRYIPVHQNTGSVRVCPWNLEPSNKRLEFVRNRTAAACKTNVYLTGDTRIQTYVCTCTQRWESRKVSKRRESLDVSLYHVYYLLSRSMQWNRTYMYGDNGQPRSGWMATVCILCG